MSVPANQPSRFDDLASRCLDGSLTAAEEAEFLKLLEDPIQRRAFAELERVNLELLASLAAPLSDEEMLRLVRKDACGVSSSSSSQRAEAVMERVQRPSVRKARKARAAGNPWALPLGIAALLALVIGAAVVLRPKRPQAEEIATLIAVDGPVARVVSGVEEPLSAPMKLNAGDTVQTKGSSTLEFLYADGTRVGLTPSTAVTLQEKSALASGKTVRIASGSVLAKVAPQAAGAPMRLFSPHAEAQVLGTELLLDVRRGSTRLDVTEGKVRITALESQKSIDVNAGKYAVASAGVPLAAMDIQPAVIVATPAVPEPVWETLFKTSDLSDWKVTRGNARMEEGVAILESTPRRQPSRMESLKSYPAIEIECELRLTDTHLGEFQLEGYLWFFQVDLGPRQKGEWHRFKASFDGETRQAWLDGHPLTLERGEGIGPKGGSIAFYVSHRGKMEIRGAKVRVPRATK